MTETQSDRHPVGLIVEDDLERNRLTVFFRLLLAIPQIVVIALWAFVAYLVVIIACPTGCTRSSHASCARPRT